MTAVFTPTRHKLTVDDYHKLGDAGVLNEDSRVELIEGELIENERLGELARAVAAVVVEDDGVAVGDAGGLDVCGGADGGGEDEE